jgi:cob(I)alamin adenosyltransferase
LIGEDLEKYYAKLLRENDKTMKIYTKTGDSGETGLFGGERIWKNSPRLEVCGTYDELNALLGLVRSEQALPEEVDRLLDQFQNDLFNAGSEMATVPPAKPQCPVLGEEHIRRIEAAIDHFENALPPLANLSFPAVAARPLCCTSPELYAAGRNENWWPCCNSNRERSIRSN